MAMQLDESHDDPILAEINVTPLVDVMLVLLIIFMIATPMLHQGVEVNLPQVTSEPLEVRDQDPMVITVGKEEVIFIKDEPVHASQLVERLLPLMESREDKTVFLKGDRDVAYGQVADVIGVLNEAGIPRVALVMEQKVGRR